MIYHKTHPKSLIVPEYPAIYIPEEDAAPAPPVTNRYDNSAAQLWYKCTDAANPFVNSGAKGSHDLAYEVAADMAVATFGVPSIFTDGNAIALTDANLHCRYSWTGDDSAILGSIGTIWTWFNPTLATLRESYVWGRVTGDGTGTSPARYGPFNIGISTASGANTSLRIGYKIGGVDGQRTAWWTVPGDTPSLLAATFDGAKILGYVNGAQVHSYDIAGSFDNTANDRWCAGDMVYSGGSYSAIGTLYECGYDSTVYSVATLLAMYTQADL